ncbi:hypothetical protein CALVIDRAFT_455497, partial [Calocera viscosa TUFC12733]
RIQQLENREEELHTLQNEVYQARLRYAAQFLRNHETTIHDYDFQPGQLVLVRNTRIENDLGRKTKARYFGPLIVVHRNAGGSYIIADLDGSILRVRIAAFRVIPFATR